MARPISPIARLTPTCATRLSPHVFFSTSTERFTEAIGPSPSTTRTGTTKNVAITVHGDTLKEPPLLYGEWILVHFTNPSGATIDPSFWGLGIGVIIDDDPTPTIIPGGVGVVEGNAGDVTVQVPVRLSNPSAQPITVDFHTLDTGAAGIATAGVDYVAASGTVTFAPGETTKTVSITVHGDAVHEPPLLWGEWILVAFTHPSANATLDTSFFGVGVGVILDDD